MPNIFRPHEKLWVPTYGPYTKCYYHHEDTDNPNYIYVELSYIGSDVIVRIHKVNVRR